jgi:large subunit ribosomal protein L2
LRYNKLGFIASFQFINFKNKLVSLIFFANGAITYYLTAERHSLLSYFFWSRSKRIRKFSYRTYFKPLWQIKKLTFVSYFEITPGASIKYCRSTGAIGRLTKIEKYGRIAELQLPSKQLKIASAQSLAMLGALSGYENKKYFNTKSGYWRMFGRKQVVRGVAMNPVDHPHGGRTKAIRYQRTPWGRTTKYK